MEEEDEDDEEGEEEEEDEEVEEEDDREEKGIIVEIEVVDGIVEKKGKEGHSVEEEAKEAVCGGMRPRTDRQHGKYISSDALTCENIIIIENIILI